MKPFNINIFLLLIAICNFIACDKFEPRTVEIDIADHEQKLTLQAIFQENSEFVVHLFLSRSILDNLGWEKVETAIVKLYENDRLISDFSYETVFLNGGNGDRIQVYVPLETIQFQEDKNYRLEASYQDYPQVKASCQLLKQLNNLAIEITDSLVRIPDDNNEKFELTIRFDDEAAIENYYYLSVYSTSIYCNPKLYGCDGSETADLDPCVYCKDFEGEEYSCEDFNLCVNSYNANFNSYNPSLEKNQSDFEGDSYFWDEKTFFQDDLFNGDRVSISIILDKYYLKEVQNDNGLFGLTVEIGSISEDYYLFEKSKALYEFNKDNPFAEPVNVYSNVENGFGLFAAINKTIIKLK